MMGTPLKFPDATYSYIFGMFAIIFLPDRKANIYFKY